jgi:ATP-dependent helicase HrpB
VIDPAALPIHTVRADFEAALDRGPVVVSSPTGSGKSTEIPRWCAARGRVLVVEPRRVACRSLAARVADLEGVALGGTVGYAVRDESVYGPDTRVLFATPRRRAPRPRPRRLGHGHGP